MDKELENARNAGRDFGLTVPAGPNRADHVMQVAWSYAAGRVLRNIDTRAIADAFIAGAN